MKFSKQMIWSTATVATLLLSTQSSFVATAAKKVVFEVDVVGKVISTSITLTRYSTGLPGLLAVLKLHDEPIVQVRAFDLQKDAPKPEVSTDSPRSRSTFTTGPISPWLAYFLLWMLGTTW